MVALMIEAAVKAVDDMLPEGLVTVGKYMEIEYQKPTVLGMMASVKAELTEQNGSILVFDIKAFDEIGVIGKGKSCSILKRPRTLYIVIYRFCLWVPSCMHGPLGSPFFCRPPEIERPGYCPVLSGS